MTEFPRQPDGPDDGRGDLPPRFGQPLRADESFHRELAEEREPTIDALLDEVIGGHAPPDLSERVFVAWLAEEQGQRASLHNVPPAHADGAHVNGANGKHHGAYPLPPRIEVAQAEAAQSDDASIAAGRSMFRRRRRRLRARQSAMFVGWSIMLATCVWILAVKLGQGDGQSTESVKATHPSETVSNGTPKRREGSPDVPPPTTKDSAKDASPDEQGKRIDAPRDVPSRSPASQGENVARGDALPKNATPTPVPHAPEPDVARRVVQDSPRPRVPTDAPSLPLPPAPRDESPSPFVVAASSDAEVIASINRQVRHRWSAATVTPSSPATEAEWLRRLFLAVVGRIPTLEEIETFVADRSPGKREMVVDRLLVAPQYAEEFARNWSNVYTTSMLGMAVGDTPGEVVQRAALQQYLRQSLLENKPYDEMASELITATGSTRPQDADYNGAAGFLVGKMDDGGMQATVRTAQVFLGVQIQCTQCHNHPFHDWKQSRYWELNAFFRQTKTTDASSGGKLADVDFAGDNSAGADDDEAEIYYEERNGRLRAAYPVFFDGTAVSRSGRVSAVHRRRELARLLVASPWFAQAATNRIWSHFFGYGFTRPVDDMGPHNPPTHPELLEQLSREFAARRFDAKSLIRWIVLSEPFALSSRPSRDNVHDDPTAGAAPLFSRYYLRQMRPEQLYDSLSILAVADRRGDDDRQKAIERQKDKVKWMQQFVIAYRTDECDECNLFVGSIPQTLSMMNGDLISAATDSAAPGVVGRVARSMHSDARKVQQLFLAGVARNPTPGEQAAARRVLAAHGAHTAEAFEDIWWALLNSNEFILDR